MGQQQLFPVQEGAWPHARAGNLKPSISLCCDNSSCFQRSSWPCACAGNSEPSISLCCACAGNLKPSIMQFVLQRACQQQVQEGAWRCAHACRNSISLCCGELANSSCFQRRRVLWAGGPVLVQGTYSPASCSL